MLVTSNTAMDTYKLLAPQRCDICKPNDVLLNKGESFRSFVKCWLYFCAAFGLISWLQAHATNPSHGSA